MTEIRKSITAALEERGLTQVDLSREVGVETAAVNHWVQDRAAGVSILPRPERAPSEVRLPCPNPDTGMTAMRVATAHEEAHDHRVHDVREKNMGCDLTSLDTELSELRLIEIEGLAAATGSVRLSPNERHVAPDSRDCYWLCIVTGCAARPTPQDPVRDPPRFPWRDVSEVQCYWLEVNAMTDPMTLRKDAASHGEET